MPGPKNGLSADGDIGGRSDRRSKSRSRKTDRDAKNGRSDRGSSKTETGDKLDKAPRIEKSSREVKVDMQPRSRQQTALEAVEELESFLSKAGRKLEATVSHSGGLVLKEAPDAYDRLSARSRSRTRSRGNRSRSRSYGSWGQRPIHQRFGKGYGKYGGKGYLPSRPNADRGSNGNSGVARVHVNGLPKGTTERDVKEMFAEYGEVLGLHMLGSRGGKVGSIVRYSKPNSAEDAISALRTKYDIQLAKPNARWDNPDN